jgi:hypothetical protein
LEKACRYLSNASKKKKNWDLFYFYIINITILEFLYFENLKEFTKEIKFYFLDFICWNKTRIIFSYSKICTELQFLLRYRKMARRDVN